MLVGYLLVTIIGVDHPVRRCWASPAVVAGDSAIANAIATGRRLDAELGDHLPVPGRGADDPLLRPARAQGGLRPPAAGRGPGRRARPGRAAAGAADRRRRCTRPSSAPPRRTGRRRRAGRRRRRSRSRRSGRPRAAGPRRARTAAGAATAPPPTARRATSRRVAPTATAAAERRRPPATTPPAAATRAVAARPPTPEPRTTTTSRTAIARLAAARGAARAGRAVSRARVAGVVLLLAAAASCLAPRGRACHGRRGREFRTLAREAVDDRRRSRELRAVDSVDGRRGRRRAARCAARAASARRAAAAARGAVRGGAARRATRARDARDVLAEARFHETSVPGPFRGMHRLARRPAAVAGCSDWLDDLIPGGALGRLDRARGARSPCVALVRRAALADARASARRPQAERRRGRGRATRTRGRSTAAPTRPRPPATSRPRCGCASAPGLLRLDERGAIEFRPSISTYEVRRALRSDDFDALAATFDDVVYGGRAPEADDVAAARERWPRGRVDGRRRVRLPRDPRVRFALGLVGLRWSRSAIVLRGRSTALTPDAEGPAVLVVRDLAGGARRLRRRCSSAPGIRCGGCARRSPSRRRATGETLVVLDPRRDGARGGAGDRRLGARRRAARRRRQRRRVAGSTRCSTSRRLEPTAARRRRTLVPVAETAGVDARCARSTAAAGTSSAARCRVIGPADAPLLVTARSGEGSVALLADASPLQNAALGAADNAALGLALAGGATPGRVPGDRARLRRLARLRRPAGAA